MENCLGCEGDLDVLEFLAHSEWAAVAAGTIWMLRQPLRSMFDRVTPTKVDVLGVKAEFEKKLATAGAVVPPFPAEIADETSDPKLNIVVTAALLAEAAVVEVSARELGTDRQAEALSPPVISGRELAGFDPAVGRSNLDLVMVHLQHVDHFTGTVGHDVGSRSVAHAIEQDAVAT